MGRYVTGDWEWKFAFGDQSSSFGEVMELILADEELNYVSRYVGTEGQGEYVEISVEDEESFIKACNKFIGKGFKLKTDEQLQKKRENGEYWDRVMIWKLLKDHKDGIPAQINVYVEY